MDVQRDNYRAAYNLASEELRRIHEEFEQLVARRERVARVMEALQPRIGMKEDDPEAGLTLTSQIETSTVVTRIAVTYSGPRP